MNFLMYTPQQYTHKSGGVKTNYYLCHLINQTEHKCFVTKQGNPSWDNPILIDDKIDYTILPEIIPNTTKEMGNIVRWCLNFPGKLGGDTIYPDHEMIWYYHDSIYSTIKNKCDITNKLFIPSLDKSEYEIMYAKTIPACCYVGKGRLYPEKMNVELPIKNIPTITIHQPSEKQDVIAIMQSSKIMYSYDNYTIATTEALLCGCEVFVLNDQLQWESFTRSKVDIETEFMNLTQDLVTTNMFISKVINYFL